MFEKLEIFWMRLQKSKIDCVCLKTEKALLLKENEDLKKKLKHYLVTANMMTNTYTTQKSEMFTIRPSSMKIEKVEHIAISEKSQLIKKSKLDKRPFTCIEGNLSNAVRHLRVTTRPMTDLLCHGQ